MLAYMYMLLHRGICIFGAIFIIISTDFTVYQKCNLSLFHWLAFVLAFASWSHLPLAKIKKKKTAKLS